MFATSITYEALAMLINLIVSLSPTQVLGGFEGYPLWVLRDEMMWEERNEKATYSTKGYRWEDGKM